MLDIKDELLKKDSLKLVGLSMSLLLIFTGCEKENEKELIILDEISRLSFESRICSDIESQLSLQKIKAESDIDSQVERIMSRESEMIINDGMTLLEQLETDFHQEAESLGLTVRSAINAVTNEYGEVVDVKRVIIREDGVTIDTMDFLGELDKEVRRREEEVRFSLMNSTSMVQLNELIGQVEEKCFGIQNRLDMNVAESQKLGIDQNRIDGAEEIGSLLYKSYASTYNFPGDLQGDSIGNHFAVAMQFFESSQ